ncbi:hypothetical protein F4553_001973 [Allocatelliglobosispora scoriae]|uniref:CopG family transcriptional regulator n=1 Tax=Allocatelliglobosispora scoriae TaxID=643052 RepID=A0A841BJZ8_9ACTN|nr:hypothetical protein [Allocatelliglobosispora scoriae]MBB5868594.1 hypothetical protein [Allocatelliglobosispora scoriae]
MAVTKYSISVPEDVAAQLEGVENVSAYVTEALRLRRRGDRLQAVFARHGVEVTPEGVAAMGARIEAQQSRLRARRGAGEAA